MILKPWTRWVLLSILVLRPLWDGGEDAPQERSRDDWQAIVDSGYEVPDGESAHALLVELSGLLGSPDPELRDGFGYGIAASWIARQKLCDADELRDLVHRWSKNLGSGIGATEGDSVFLRSFSALDLSLLVYRDNHDPFLEHGEFEGLLDAALTYLAKERDLRGWREGVGWIHAAAHTADLLKFLGRSRHLTAEGQRRILAGIGTRVLETDGHVFRYDEDERLVAAILSLLDRDDVEVSFLESFVDVLSRGKESTVPGGFDPVAFASRRNAKSVLRILFVALSRREDLSDPLVRLRERLLGGLSAL